jgi:hypothetical protein
MRIRIHNPDFHGRLLLFKRSIQVCGRDPAKWLERLAVNAKVATVLGSIAASSDTVESEGREMNSVE